MAEEVEVARAHRSDRTDLFGCGGVEDCRQPREAGFDLLDIDDVGLVDAGLGPGGGHVVDLDGQRWSSLGVVGGETGEQRGFLERTQVFDACDGLFEFTVQVGTALPEFTAMLLCCLLTSDDVGEQRAVLVEATGNVSD